MLRETGKFLEVALSIEVLGDGYLPPGALGRQLPRQLVVGEDHLEDFPQPGPDVLGRNVDEGLDPAVQVALHHVGRAEEVAAARREAEPDPGRRSGDGAAVVVHAGRAGRRIAGEDGRLGSERRRLR